MYYLVVIIIWLQFF